MQAISAEKLERWRLLILAREKSNLTVTEFCHQKNITPSRFYYYQTLINFPEKIIKKQQKKLLPPKLSAKLQPIKITKSSTVNKSTSIRLFLPNSIRCDLPSNIPIAEMKAIVDFLLSC
jgi:hypothetical protein